MEISSDPALTIPTRTSVHALEFSPYEWSHSLLAVAHSSSIAVYSVKFKEESEDGKTQCQQIWECHIANEPVDLSWSPMATLRSIPKCLQLMVATISHSVVQLTTNIEEDHTLQEMMSHKDNINSIAYSGDSSELCGASTGDDLVVNVWNCSSKELVAKFLLMSPGMSLKFHPDDPDTLVVGERNGTIRVYSVSSNTVQFSMRCPAPLLGVDWSLADTSYIGTAGPGGITVWNLSGTQPHRKFVKIGGGENITSVALSRCSPTIAATTSVPNTLRIVSINSSKVPMAAHLKALSGVSWHLQLPYLAGASDSKILIWRNDSV